MTATLPKAELHAHFEGTMSPDLVRRLAERNGIEVPAGLFRSESEFAWTDFPDFLNTYDMAASCLRTPQDFRDAMYEYLAASAAEGALYVEVFTSPDHAAEMGLSYAAHTEGIVAGIDDAHRDFGIVGRIIVTCVRHLGPEQSIGVVKAMVAEPHPYVVGFGMGGNEMDYTFEDFRPAFEMAAEAGYPCTVHAGEIDGAASVRAALDTLPISRLGHGVRSIEDRELVAEIAERGIVLEICPGSNLAVGVFNSYDDHPLPKLMEAGCRVTLNSDDPPYFATSIGREYANAATGFGLTDGQLLGMTRTALEAAFVDDATKAGLLSRLDEAAAAQ